MSNNLSSRCSLNQLSLSQPQHSLRPSLCLKKKATKMKQPQQRQQQRVALTLFSIRFSLRLYSAQKKQRRKRKMEIMMRRNCYNTPKMISFLWIWPNHARILRLDFNNDYNLTTVCWKDLKCIKSTFNGTFAGWNSMPLLFLKHWFEILDVWP